MLRFRAVSVINERFNREAGRNLLLANVAFAAFLLTLAQPAMSQTESRLSPAMEPCPDPQVLYEKLQRLALEASTSTYGLAGKRVVATNKSILVNLHAAPYSFITSTPDRITVPFELLIRTYVIRRDISMLEPKQTFQNGPLQQLESIARRMVDSACKSATGNDWQEARRADESKAKKSLDVIAAGLEDFARIANLDFGEGRGPAEGFMITIRKNPAEARLRIMPQFDFDLCDLDQPGKSTGHSRIEACLDKKWRTPSSTERLIGKYRYRLEPVANGRSIEDTFIADRDKTISLP